MAPAAHLRDSLSALSILLKISAVDGGVLFLQAIFFLALDPYLNDQGRGTISMSVIANALWNQHGEVQELPELKILVYWLAMPILMYFEYGTLSGSPGPLIATAQMWIQNRMIPLAWAYARATNSDEQIIGEAINAFVPLAFFGSGILCFKYFTATAMLLWFCMTDPGLWLLITIGIGLFQVWKTVLTEDMRSFVTTKMLSRVKQSFASFAISSFKASLLPYRYLALLERTIIQWREQNMESRPTYMYSELESGHIRLLRVSRRVPFSGVRCQIIHVPLSSTPPYEAISYCWGTDSASKIVLIDGKSMRVLDSVHEVLHYRYSFRQEKLLWIDSVCINQKDDIEKGEQIQLMRTIFSEAVGVLAWLGDMENGIIASSFIRTLGAKVEIFGQTAQDLLLDFRDSNDIGWKYLGILFSKPWFTRSWMLQEIALAKQVQLVFGGVSLDWEIFAKALPIIGDPLLGRFLGSSDAEYEVIRPMLGASNAMIMEGCRALAHASVDVTLSEILQFSLQFQATQAHDKIYSILGLVRDSASKSIVPDYRKSVERVFKDTMRCLLQSSSPLSSLHLAGSGTSRKCKIPSWVPDWSNSTIRLFHTTSMVTYHAGTKFAPQVFVPPEEQTPFIRVGGNVVDEILIVGQIGPLGADELKLREKDLVLRQEHLILGWLKEAKGLVAKYIKEPYVVGIPPRTKRQSREEVLWRTIIADKTSGIMPAPSESGKGYAALEWYLGLSSDARAGSMSPYKQHTLPENQRTIPKNILIDLSTAANTFLYHVGAGSLGNRLAVTKSGLFAVVPPNTRIGDIVSIIWGTQTPYLMRPGAMKIAGQQSWELVGSCFVHGLMDGEGVDGDGMMFTFV